MSLSLIAEQMLNGIQLGTMLFLMSTGLTLVFGIMNFINLSHASLYMIGAFIAASTIKATGSFMLGLVAGIAGTAILGMLLEIVLLRHFFNRSHLDQVLVTFGLILIFNDAVQHIWGPLPLPMPLPQSLAGSVQILPGVAYPTFRLFIIVLGIAAAVLLYLVISYTKIGMWVRAGASDRETTEALGVNVRLLFILLFSLGSALAGLAGIVAGPLTAVQVGMGEPILILALVVTVIGGIGSVRGAFVAAILVGVTDTFGRVLLSPAIGSMLIFLMMAAILAFFPQGLYRVHR